MLDMGGVAKGSAVDMAYDELEKAGCMEFMVNLGGNIRAQTLKEHLLIGIRDPFDKENLIGTLKLKSGEAVATSGDYERFVILDGVKYPHIIDPRSGYPVKKTVATTIVAPNATMSDILSTATFVLGKEKIDDVLYQFPDVAILVISKNDGKMSISMSNEEVFDLL
jgi:thiamine biosynthesis lipoprotein